MQGWGREPPPIGTQALCEASKLACAPGSQGPMLIQPPPPPCAQALYEASKARAGLKAGAGAKGVAAGPPDKLDKRTLMQEAFTERMKEQQVCGRARVCVRVRGAVAVCPCVVSARHLPIMCTHLPRASMGGALPDSTPSPA